MKTANELKKEKEANECEILELKNHIATQACKYPVNELYGRLNFLVARNAEIDLELADYSQAPGNNKQLEIGKTLASTTGGVDIRPSDAIQNPEENGLRDSFPRVKPGMIYAAPEPSKASNT